MSRIGFDMTALPAQPVGAGTYMLELLNSLSASDCGHEFVVFIQKDRLRMINFAESEQMQIVPIESIPVWRRMLWEQWQLPRLAKDLQLDLLHSPHYTMPFRLACSSVVTFHDLSFFLFPEVHTHAKRLLFPILMRLSGYKADAIIAVSQTTRRDILRILKLSDSKVHTVPLGVDSKYRPIHDQGRLRQFRHKYRLPDEFVLYVGTLEPRKNVGSLITAFERIAADDPKLNLVLVGPIGWMQTELLSAIENSPSKERIHRLGYIHYEEMPLLLNLARIFAYPSLYEGFGLPVLEAMACGTPVVTSDRSSTAEIAGNAALLVNPNDDLALTHAIRSFHLDGDLRKRNATLGLKRASLYSWNATAEGTLEVYDSVLGVTGKGG